MSLQISLQPQAREAEREGREGRQGRKERGCCASHGLAHQVSIPAVEANNLNVPRNATEKGTRETRTPPSRQLIGTQWDFKTIKTKESEFQ